MSQLKFDRPIAHRGLHDRAAGVIENSASAFEAAIAGRYHIECDLQLSSDGVPIVFHDDDLERLTGRTGAVGSLTAAELTTLPLLGSATGDCPQRFTEMLKQVAGRTLLQVELKQQPKGPGTERLAQAAAEAIAAYDGPVTVESFDPWLLVAIRRAGYRGQLGIITYGYDKPEWDGHLTVWQTVRSALSAALPVDAVRLHVGLQREPRAWRRRASSAAGASRSPPGPSARRKWPPRRWPKAPTRSCSRDSMRTRFELAIIVALLSGPALAQNQTLPPTDTNYDSQLGGPYDPAPGVGIVSRDRTAPPAPGLYSICYVNAFQTQPDEADWWNSEHPDLLLMRDGSLFEDENWPGEYLLDITTAGKARGAGRDRRTMDRPMCTRRVSGRRGRQPRYVDTIRRADHDGKRRRLCADARPAGARQRPRPRAEERRRARPGWPRARLRFRHHRELRGLR